MSRALMLIMLVLSTSCSSYTPPRPLAGLERETQLAVPVETAWRRVIRYFSEHNIPIDNMDHSSYFIKTRAVDLTATFGGTTLSGREVPIKNAWCDCGSASLANVWTSSSRITLLFNIVLESNAEAASTVRVNTFFEGVKLGKRNLYGSGYDTQMPLTCVSTGRLESEIAAYLREEKTGER